MQRKGWFLLIIFKAILPAVIWAAPQNVAVLIGNADYKDSAWEELPYAVNDITAMKKLVERLGYEEIIFIQNATMLEFETTFGSRDEKTARKEISDLGGRIDKGKSKVFIYYSGHGGVDDDQELYLIPVNGKRTAMRTTGYPMSVLKRNVEMLNLKQDICYILDCCFSGKGGKATVKIPKYEKVIPGESLFIASSQGRSWDYENRNSLFTYWLLRGWRDGLAAENGQVQLGTLMDYVTTNVKEYSRREKKEEQIPYFKKEQKGVILEQDVYPPTSTPTVTPIPSRTPTRTPTATPKRSKCKGSLEFIGNMSGTVTLSNAILAVEESHPVKPAESLVLKLYCGTYEVNYAGSTGQTKSSIEIDKNRIKSLKLRLPTPTPTYRTASVPTPVPGDPCGGPKATATYVALNAGAQATATVNAAAATATATANAVNAISDPFKRIDTQTQHFPIAQENYIKAGTAAEKHIQTAKTSAVESVRQCQQDYHQKEKEFFDKCLDYAGKAKDEKSKRQIWMSFLEAFKWNTERRQIVSDYINGKRSFIPPVWIEMVRIKPGTFTMGSPKDESGRDDDERQHEVTLTKAFEIGKYEITQGQWKAVMGTKPSHFNKCGEDCPVERVSWEDCQEFIKKLNSLCPGMKYRLPTEAEWEYACRAGTTTRYYWGDSDSDAVMKKYCWYENNAQKSAWSSPHAENEGPQPVGQKISNAWGLYDMSGNVWEWCQDWYKEKYPSGSVTDPIYDAGGSYRVIRGGSWINNARLCRSANRGSYSPGYRYFNIGFRLARTP